MLIFWEIVSKNDFKNDLKIIILWNVDIFESPVPWMLIFLKVLFFECGYFWKSSSLNVDIFGEMEKTIFFRNVDLSEIWAKIDIFLRLILNELCPKNDFTQWSPKNVLLSTKKWSQNRPFDRNIGIKRVMVKKRFFQNDLKITAFSLKCWQ